jgi:hypothetical protein
VQRSLKTRLFVRVATAAIACAGATLGLAATASAAPAAGTAAAPASADRAAAVGPYSTAPGSDWFFYYAYLGANLQNAKYNCESSAALLWTTGGITGSYCGLRWDYSGYDLWLRN